MGVKGLWQLIDTAGKPIPLERLENRVLAIDVSIWLNQSLAGFRDASGGSGVVSQAHILGLFHRVCKLLFYRIKPIFVFDGKPPQLKKDLLAKRRMRKAGAGKKADKTRSKIVENYVKQQIVAKQLQRQTEQVSKALEGGQAGLAHLLSDRKGGSTAEKDLFELPIPRNLDEDDFSDDGERYDVLGRLDIDHSTDIHAVDLGSSDFKTLSATQKYEVLLELREKRKQSSWAKLGEMPQEARSFSGYQMERLRKRRTIQKMTDEVGTELTDNSLAVADSKLFVGDREGMRRERKRIVGKDFIYMEGIRDSNLTDYEKTLANRVESEDGVTQDLIALASKKKETALDLVEPSTSFQSSSRRGGVKSLEDDSDIEHEPRPSTSGLPAAAHIGKSEPLQDLQIDMNVVTQTSFNEKDDIFADVFKPKPTIVRNARSASSSSTSDFMSSDGDSDDGDGGIKGKEKELFVDVNESDLDKLHKVLKEGEAVDIKPKNNDRNRVLGAAATADSIEDMFANVSTKTRKFEDSGEPDESRARVAKRQKIQEHDIASTMKESSHLFLKIKSKWVEDSEGPSAEKEDRKKIEVRNYAAKGEYQANKMSKMLEEENKALVCEMERKRGEERLLKIKASEYKTAFPKVMAKSGAIGTSQGEEEKKMLKSMSVEASSVDAYTKSIIGIEEDISMELRADADVPLDEAKDKGDGDDKDPVVYGSSAQGFVRGSRSSNIVEVDKDESGPDDGAPVDQSIVTKLDNTEGDADVLTEGELRAIQERLARDTSALIAERGKHDRIAATVSDQMYADCQELLQMFGIPWVVAPSEAEAQCAFFDLIGMTDGSVTDDSDVWLFGGQNVFKEQKKDSLKPGIYVTHGIPPPPPSPGQPGRRSTQFSQNLEYSGVPLLPGWPGGGGIPQQRNVKSAFWAPVGFMNFFNQDKHCETFTSAEIGRHFGLSREKMVLLALLTGSDYTEGIPDVGPVTAMEILAEFPGTGIDPLNEFKGWWEDQQTLSGKVPIGSKTREKFKKFQLPESFPNQKIIDAYLYPTVDNSTEGFSWAVPNFVEIRDFAQERFGWTRQKVDELIKPVIKRFDTKVTQSKIENFFHSDRLALPSKGKGLIQNSKRVQEAVERVLGTRQAADVETKEKTREQKSNQRKVPIEGSRDIARSRPMLTPAEKEEKRKAEAKAKAAQVWKKTRSVATGAKSKKGGAKKRPVRKVMSQHNLSESDSD